MATLTLSKLDSLPVSSGPYGPQPTLWPERPLDPNVRKLLLSAKHSHGFLFRPEEKSNAFSSLQGPKGPPIPTPTPEALLLLPHFLTPLLPPCFLPPRHPLNYPDNCLCSVCLDHPLRILTPCTLRAAPCFI